MLPSTLFSAPLSPMCYADTHTFLAPYTYSVPRLPHRAMLYNHHCMNSYFVCSLFLFHHNSSMDSLLFLTPPAPRCILLLRSWHCDCHHGKRSTALASLCLGFTPGWSGKKSIPRMMNWFGLSERRTFPMNLSLVSSIPA